MSTTSAVDSGRAYRESGVPTFNQPFAFRADLEHDSFERLFLANEETGHEDEGKIAEGKSRARVPGRNWAPDESSSPSKGPEYLNTTHESSAHDGRASDGDVSAHVASTPRLMNAKVSAASTTAGQAKQNLEEGPEAPSRPVSNKAQVAFLATEAVRLPLSSTTVALNSHGQIEVYLRSGWLAPESPVTTRWLETIKSVVASLGRALGKLVLNGRSIEDRT